MKYQYIAEDDISELLFNEPEHIIEFCEAGISSFSEFNTNFSKHLTDRNLENLRKAGHKIKPGAQMMGADIVVELYEKSRDKLESENASDEYLVKMASQMNEICTRIQLELKDLAKSLA